MSGGRQPDAPPIEGNSEMTIDDGQGFATKVVVVTGGAVGLGRQISEDLASLGARVVVLDRQVEASAPAAGITPFRCDVSDPASVLSASEFVAERFGRCDGLVNNAGILNKALLAEETPENWDRTMAVNLRGPFLCTQRFGALMREQGGGSIVNICSIGGSVPAIGAGAYTASKAGLLALTRQAALELGTANIRVNSVSPSYMETPMTADRYAVSGLREARAKRVPLGRIAALSEVASVVVFLLSERASYVSGREILVDGGFAQTLTQSMRQPE
jgi:NAD(P)-dependent dehydrogenase (short-subunit alcohol dehydrogenase family)